mgnify:CR=1 FL=1
MKILKYIGIGIVVLFLLFLLVAAFLPTEVTTKGELYIKAPSSTIFYHVNSMKNWAAWSPFQRADTTMEITYRGSESGVGSEMFWTNPRHDSGIQVISESFPHSYIRMELDFFTGGKAYSTWSFEETGDSTLVSWKVFISELGYPMGRFFGLLMPSMMKPMHEQGLMNLKTISEENPSLASITDMPEIHALYIRDSAMADQIGNKMGECYGEIMTYMQDNQVDMAGAPFCIYYTWDENNPFVMEPSIPVSKPIAFAGKSRIQFRTLPAGKYLKATHYGPYELSGITHMAAQKYMIDNQIEMNGFPYEVYITDPMKTPDTALWLTEIYYPLK